jgi:hypothetical protein
MSENNPYQVPQSNLEVPQNSTHSLNPDWKIDDLLNEAWQLTKGFKASYWGALIIYIVIAAILGGLTEVIAGNSVALNIIFQLIQGLITYPLAAGLTMIAVRQSVGLPCNATMIFNYYPKTIPIFLLYLLMTLLIVVGMLLLIIPGIYLAIAYCFALILLVDKNLGIWEALETSRQAVTKCWFRTFGLFIVIFIIILVSMIPLGIGLIWSLPFGTLAFALVYRNLFGVSQTN